VVSLTPPQIAVFGYHGQTVSVETSLLLLRLCHLLRRTLCDDLALPGIEVESPSVCIVGNCGQHALQRGRVRCEQCDIVCVKETCDLNSRDLDAETRVTLELKDEAIDEDGVEPRGENGALTDSYLHWEFFSSLSVDQHDSPHAYVHGP
jgi:hypothetical protein